MESRVFLCQGQEGYWLTWCAHRACEPDSIQISLDECSSSCHMLFHEADNSNRRRVMAQVLRATNLRQVADLADAALRSVHTRICPIPSLETETDFVGDRVLIFFLEGFEQSGVQSKESQQASLRLWNLPFGIRRGQQRDGFEVDRPDLNSLAQMMGGKFNLLRELGTGECQYCSGFILSKTSKGLDFDKTVSLLEGTFGGQSPLLSRRYNCLWLTKCADGDYLADAEELIESVLQILAKSALCSMVTAFWFAQHFYWARILQKYCDTLLRHGGERCPQQMLFCSLDEVEATADTGRLVADLFGEVVWLILMQRGNLVR
ncbi:unnamed protein product [Taenia asiatica]|uniref:Protein kinase domain-containing protein n=1 Tax=Taenia asiatica TaxID=60517 RepID=A0A0R3WEP3_TAEAS|nr:unnamed protein product [Taenia asiatica]